MQQQDTTNFGDRLQTSFTQVFGQTLPALLGALVILFAGYLLAKVLEKLTERGLRRIRLNHLLERGGVTQAVERSGTHVNPTRVLANLVFWLVMFTVILLAANALGLESLANVVSTLVSYIPSVIAAIVIILVGIVLGGFVGGIINASAGAVHGGRALARIGRGGVLLLAIFMALQELGIATDIVTTAFAILFGAIALISWPSARNTSPPTIASGSATTRPPQVNSAPYTSTAVAMIAAHCANTSSRRVTT